MVIVKLLATLVAATIAAVACPSFALSATDIAVERLEAIDPSGRQARLDFVVRELAMSIGGPPNRAVASLGLYEFEIATDHRLAFIHAEPRTTTETSPWQDLAEGGTPSAVGYLPGLSFRKGLPWSFEVGVDTAWLASTRQFVIGGYGRWAFVGGWDKVPDAAIQVGYKGYVGNDELELGVLELDLSVGYTFKASSKKERPGTRFSPFAGYSLLLAHAQPLTEVEDVGSVSAWSTGASVGVDPRDFRFHRFFGGMEVLAGQLVFRAGGDVTVPRDGPLLGSITLSLGARF